MVSSAHAHQSNAKKYGIWLAVFIIAAILFAGLTFQARYLRILNKKATQEHAQPPPMATNYSFEPLSVNFPTKSQQLWPNFYARSCPAALPIIRRSIHFAIARERRMAASLLRLHFHDCFVHGCDASILLDQSQTVPSSEKIAAPNDKSVRGYEVIDAVKFQLERICPGVVSCADILAVAARDAVTYSGGPSWNVKLGRKDSTAAFPALAVSDLPSFKANLTTLINGFWRHGLSPRDMVALSGAHTLGQARCSSFRDRIYFNLTTSNINRRFASVRRRQCPLAGGDGILAPFDFVTPTTFDNNYFKNLVRRNGLLQSDQVLFSGGRGPTDKIVLQYSKSNIKFFIDFAMAMMKMGDIQPPVGSVGEIRRNCRAVNS